MSSTDAVAWVAPFTAELLAWIDANPEACMDYDRILAWVDDWHERQRRADAARFERDEEAPCSD